MPRLLYYNPTCEMAVQNGSVSYRPPLRLQLFERDLAEIMLWTSRPDDIVVADRPSDRFVERWQSAGLQMPGFEPLRPHMAADHPDHTFAPWGASRAAAYLFYGKDRWNSHLRTLLSRRTSVEFERRMMQAGVPELLQCRPALLLTCADEAARLIGSGRCAVKSLWSSSGRGVALVRRPEHIAPAIVWARGRIRHDGGVVVEPFLDRVADLTFQFEISPQAVKYLGFNVFEADEAGRFAFEIIGGRRLLDRMAADGTLPADWERTCVDALTRTISQSSWRTSYCGIAGFDAMVHRLANGRTRIRCCTEVNLRHNMGLVNMRLASLLTPGATGRWQISQFDADGRWDDFCATMQARHPATTDAYGRISSGFVALTADGHRKRFGAWGVVGEG